MESKYLASRADWLIAEQYLLPNKNVLRALRWMARNGHFTVNKPAEYWFVVLRNVYRDSLHVTVSEEVLVEADETRITVHRYDSYVTSVPESTYPIQSVINFLLLTLNLSFIKWCQC